MPASSVWQSKARIALPNRAAKPSKDIEPGMEGKAIGTEADTHTSAYCSSDKLGRILAWRKNMPFPDNHLDGAMVQALPIDLYKDWLDWAAHDAAVWLRKLDKFEQRFRTAGLAYHQVPYQLRHSPAMLHGSSIEQPLLTRLPQILETDRPRHKQMFFIPWLEIKNTATRILEYSLYNFPLVDDLNHLYVMHRELELSLWKVYKSANVLEAGLQWLEGAVAKVVRRSDLDGADALASKYSREGGLLRRWIQTFPESEGRSAKSKLHFIEGYVAKVLEVGIEEDIFETSNMCHKCAPMYLDELPQDAQDAITHLNTLSHAIDEASSSANKLEDIHRDIKTCFEISSTSDYNSLFEKIHMAIINLADLRSTHVRYSGTTEKLVQRALVLDMKVTILSQQIADLHAALEDRAATGVRCAWQDTSGMDPLHQPVPSRQEQGWALFPVWVGALPETGKAVGHVLWDYEVSSSEEEPQAQDDTTPIRKTSHRPHTSDDKITTFFVRNPELDENVPQETVLEDSDEEGLCNDGRSIYKEELNMLHDHAGSPHSSRSAISQASNDGVPTQHNFHERMASQSMRDASPPQLGTDGSQTPPTEHSHGSKIPISPPRVDSCLELTNTGPSQPVVGTVRLHGSLQDESIAACPPQPLQSTKPDSPGKDQPGNGAYDRREDNNNTAPGMNDRRVGRHEEAPLDPLLLGGVISRISGTCIRKVYIAPV
ncbi:hypothetical protein BKA63DRAFT_588745 [Paraphoma chrysanthemicola]|nr:hypothetical protein BKA63DRAFT_588745 [Paraphoma chrysanthemicola]